MKALVTAEARKLKKSEIIAVFRGMDLVPDIVIGKYKPE